MSLYMKIASIPGDVSTQGFQDSIEVFSMQQSGRRHVLQNPGFGSTRDVSSITFSYLQVCKQQDRSSAPLYHHFCQAQIIPTIEIYHCLMLKNSADWRYKLTLSNVIVATHRELFSSLGNLEVIDLSYSQLEKGYKVQSTSGQLERPSYSGYNLETATTL